jgi:hypothetical protein
MDAGAKDPNRVLGLDGRSDQKCLCRLITCENWTGHRALSIARSLRAIGSLLATISRRSVGPGFCTG